ncbi:MAG: lipoate--protein ligase family protein [Planctomycetota bacterium]
MLLQPLTLPTPEENLALDEALLDAAEAGEAGETLRVWESPAPVVVLGRASRATEEAAADACERRGVPVLRRVSGGAAIVAGPGCLMYAVVLSIRARPHLSDLNSAHALVLDRLAEATRLAGVKATRDGISDLVINDNRRRKFSGNSLRVKRDWLLYHGTLLYRFDLELIATLLGTPPRQPAYRAGRPHDAFVVNLGVDADALRAGLAEAWSVGPAAIDYPANRVAELVRTRYTRDDWNRSR